MAGHVTRFPMANAVTRTVYHKMRQAVPYPRCPPEKGRLYSMPEQIMSFRQVLWIWSPFSSAFFAAITRACPVEQDPSEQESFICQARCSLSDSNLRKKKRLATSKTKTSNQTKKPQTYKSVKPSCIERTGY